MKRRRTALFKAGLDSLYWSRAHRALAPLTGGLGVIFTLHNVRPGPPMDFAPNRILEVTPEFLEAAVLRIRAQGLDIVSLDEARERVREGRGPRFACLTFDDGYRDNLEVAWPILRRLGVPFTIYVTTCLPDGDAVLWWLALERAIAGTDRIELSLDGVRQRLDCATVEEKYDAYEAIYWPLRSLNEVERRAATRALCDRYGIDMAAMVRSLSLTWEEIAQLDAEPLVTIGAHTISHPALARLSGEEVEQELAGSRDRIALHTAAPPRHVAYPYGDQASAGAREFEIAERLGFDTGVSNRPGLLFAEHSDHLTALPRVSLNGDYQSTRYVDLFLSGAPFALWNRFRRVDAA